MIEMWCALHLFLADPIPIPDPTPVAPPGANSITELVGNAKWGAGISLLLGILIGVIVWVGGRWIDHHRAGRIGLAMILISLAGAIVYGIAYQVIQHFAGG